MDISCSAVLNRVFDTISYFPLRSGINFSLNMQDCLSPLSMQALPALPESLCIAEMGASEDSQLGTIYLNIGLENGVLLRTVLDPVTGDLADTRTRYLGSRPVKLFRIKMQGGEAVLAMSSRSWMSYYFQNR